MTQPIKTQRRWLRSVIAASAEPLPEFPWIRGQRKRPAAVTHEIPVPDVQPVRLHEIPLFRRKSAVAAR